MAGFLGIVVELQLPSWTGWGPWGAEGQERGAAQDWGVMRPASWSRGTWSRRLIVFIFNHSRTAVLS